jgi:hypothetical protein
VPSELFPSIESENRTDVYVVKYLMRGNTARHFVDIANIYGVGIKMEHCILNDKQLIQFVAW